ncbi:MULTISPECIES: branched-chain amino acid ABC transporter permease [Variovorax]
MREARRDALPLLVMSLLAVLTLPLVGSLPVWATLTLAGLAMGMLLFIMASGLTLVFGLMDVMNLGHASFVAVGAYVGVAVAALVSPVLYGTSNLMSLLGMLTVVLGAGVTSAAVGWVFERLFVRPVYGDHLKQILVTVGALIMIEQIILALWGPQQMSLLLPEAVRGTFDFAGVSVERYRLIAVVVGLLLYIGLLALFGRTRIGLVIRAGVENREMVQSLGYRIETVFVLVFAAGAALAGLGGAMWGFYREQFSSLVGADLLVQLLIVVIIGGLGSIRGCFVGALLLALVQNYVSYLLPALALVSNVVVMVAVLLWRPTGLYSAGR